MNNEVRYIPLVTINRLRMRTDGIGVTSLVAVQDCPLHCAYCINPDCRDSTAPSRNVTPEELYEKLKIDDLYFRATGGGVTFGGGEPLLYAPFLQEYRALTKGMWTLNVETSLHVSENTVLSLADCVDEWIIDIKDVDPEIYHRYTGCDQGTVLTNLAALLSRIGPEKLHVRVPLIHGYNSEELREAGIRKLKDIGITRIETFAYVDPVTKRQFQSIP